MARNKTNQITQGYLHPNHRTPVSRRDLLSQGFISFGAYLAMPSMLGFASRRAMGQDTTLVCNKQSSTRMMPFLVIDLAGGANIAGTNVIVGGQGGQTDILPAGSYQTIGLAAEKEPGNVTVNNEMGLAFHPDSKMLAGILQTTTATTRANVDGALFCTSSGDDTRGNPHSPLYWIARSGLGGELVSLIGTSDGASGGQAAAPRASIDPSLQPSRVTRPDDALGLVDPGKLATLLSGADVNKILAATKTMSEARLKMFQQQDLPTQIQDLIRCGYINSSEFLSKFEASNLDPRQDTLVTTNFPQLANNRDQQSGATIAKLILDGYAGAGVIEMGGYDYHGQGRATQDQRDLEAGQMIGRVLELAAAKQQSLMIYVYTDGGVSAGGGGAVNGILPFSSDSGQRSAAFTLVYRAGTDGRPPINNAQRQIGAYKPGGTVDESASRISGSVELLTKAIVANYLALHGREGDLAKVVGDNPFGGELAKVLAFSKM